MSQQPEAAARFAGGNADRSTAAADDGPTMEAFTWHNFIRRKDGSPADRYLFQALLVLVLLEVRARVPRRRVGVVGPAAHAAAAVGRGRRCAWQAIYLAAWIVSWVAGGYLSTLSALVSFFVHFAGFYAIWARSSTGIFVVRARASQRWR